MAKVRNSTTFSVWTPLMVELNYILAIDLLSYKRNAPPIYF